MLEDAFCLNDVNPLWPLEELHVQVRLEKGVGYLSFICLETTLHLYCWFLENGKVDVCVLVKVARRVEANLAKGRPQVLIFSLDYTKD